MRNTVPLSTGFAPPTKSVAENIPLRQYLNVLRQKFGSFTVAKQYPLISVNQPGRLLDLEIYAAYAYTSTATGSSTLPAIFDLVLDTNIKPYSAGTTVGKPYPDGLDITSEVLAATGNDTTGTSDLELHAYVGNMTLSAKMLYSSAATAFFTTSEYLFDKSGYEWDSTLYLYVNLEQPLTVDYSSVNFNVRLRYYSNVEVS